MRLNLTFTCLLLLIVSTLSSQTPASAVLSANRVKAGFNANGRLFDNARFIAPYTPGQPEISLLQRAILWMAGRNDAGQFAGAIETYPSGGKNAYVPGPLDANGQPYPGGLLTDIYQVGRAEIELHRADFADNGVIDQPLPAVFGWPARGNPFFAQYHDGQQLPFTQEGWAGFTDLDGDGIYNPANGEYPALEIQDCSDAPAPDEMIWFVFHPNPENSVFIPIGMEIQCLAFAYNCAVETPLNNAVFVRNKLIYKGPFPVYDFHYGLYNVISIGYPYDNYFGCDTSRAMIFGYNADNEDEGGYGADIPAFGMKVLRASIHESGQIPSFSRVFDFFPGELVPDYYQYFRMSRQYLTMEHFKYPGVPNIPGADTEISAGTKPGIRHVVGSLGPKTLLPGDADELTAAYFFALGPGNTPVQNVQVLYENADAIQDFFDNCFMPPGQMECIPIADAPVVPAPAAGLHLFPNPASQSFTIESEKTGITRIRLSDMSGRVAFSQYLAGMAPRANISVAHLPNGVYLTEVWLNNGARFWEKIVVNR